VAVEPDDPEALRAALEQLLDQPRRRDEMGAAGRKWVEQWVSPAAVARAYADLVADLNDK
jgi:glycosyltransferase involved in cell wall biosynthesis